ncbi:TIGR03749 family integrating conjugative element protein [Shewanella xiamenensis]|uniref:TIGR03749 family integrating conjugative element protein n=1 Tax=Shewanella xiamenensis TaxID=332186 RepID=A0ABT6UIV0_9GAMM|nr:TIGR03749 family integrating conjugative element protein [Shewanella xiamenensis]MCR4535526.1 TIGR03749 family integrating conjugative element protein [Shewanella xiamenensis]MDI5833680.1 TIGR03749 family integrating conjugative element protein [Shewanella xiamenensis]
MKRMILLTLSMMLATPLLANSVTEAAHTRAVVWDGVPISISLPVGKEMLLSFDGDVRVGVPSALYQSASIDSLRGTIYITANKPFESQRLQVERLRDGMRMLIDVRAQDGITTASQIDIVTTDEKKTIDETKATQGALEQHVNRVAMPIPTLLVRYAYQNIYSPSHAIEPLPGVTRVTMQIVPDIQAQAFPLWPVTAKPVAAWSLGGYTVTAVTLTHKNNDTLELDPRQVTAALYGATFAFPDLGPAGTDSAINTAFLVSKGSLADSLPPAPLAKGASND